MIRWTDEAKADVEGFTVWLSQRNPLAAARVAEGVLSGIERLTDFPHLGRLGRVGGTRELVIGRWPYIVVYQVDGTNIVILRVLHGARLWPTGAGHMIPTDDDQTQVDLRAQRSQDRP